MGLKGDFSELAGVWRGAPLYLKIWLGLSGFLASASLASMAEAVAKWKGFILSGVEFYRTYIRTPVAQALADYVSVRFSHDFCDFLALSLILTIAWIRKIVLEMDENRTRWDWVMDFVCIGMMLAALVYALVRNANLPDAHPLLWPMFATWGFLLLMCMPVRRPSNLLTITYLVLPPLAVAVLGAINAGLK